MAPVDATVYAPNSDTNTFNAVNAATLRLAPGSHPWKERGPFGVDFIPGIANGGEKLTRIAGIGTALAPDPTNPNLAYFGTHGGLFVTRDGGHTIHEPVRRQDPARAGRRDRCRPGQHAEPLHRHRRFTPHDQRRRRRHRDVCQPRRRPHVLPAEGQRHGVRRTRDHHHPRLAILVWH